MFPTTPNAHIERFSFEKVYFNPLNCLQYLQNCWPFIQIHSEKCADSASRSNESWLCILYHSTSTNSYMLINDRTYGMWQLHCWAVAYFNLLGCFMHVFNAHIWTRLLGWQMPLDRSIFVHLLSWLHIALIKSASICVPSFSHQLTVIQWKPDLSDF